MGLEELNLVLLCYLLLLPFIQIIGVLHYTRQVKKENITKVGFFTPKVRLS